MPPLLDPRFGDAHGTLAGKPPAQRLVGPDTTGFQTPSQPAQQRDQLPSGPAPISIRRKAQSEARESVSDNKVAVLTAEVIAQGVRQGIRMCDGATVDPNLLEGNSRATPVSITGKFVILPASPTAADIAAGNLLAQANFAPGAYPAFGYSENFGADYQTGIITGIGTTIEVNVRPSEIMVVDKIGITTFSQAAEYELVWTLGYGSATPSATGPFNLGLQMIQARRGWPLGGVDDPFVLSGKARFAPQQGPNRAPNALVVLAVRHTGEASATYAPGPHYVEVVLTGWKPIIGAYGDTEATILGGSISDPGGRF